MKKYYLIISAVLLISFSGFSQELDKFKVSTRQNVTWLLSEYKDTYQNEVNNAIDVNQWNMSSKMDNTQIYNKILKGSGSFIDLLNEKKIANAVFLNLLLKDGQITFDIIKDKVKNNMTDADAMEFSATSVGVEGSAERKFFTSVLQSNYIAVATVRSVVTQDSKYDDTDRKNYNRAKREANDPKIKNKYQYRPVVRNKTGYHATLYVTLYKIVLDSEASIMAFEEAIFGGETEKTNQQMMDALIDYPFVLKKENNGISYVKATELKTIASQRGYDTSYYFKKMLKPSNFKNTLTTASRNIDAFKTRAPIFNTKPNIQVKIGTKEDLKTNKRFYVYERVQSKNGKIKAKKRGTIRVKGKPANNKGVARGNTIPSNFYQISGKKLDKGMLVEENNNTMSFGLKYRLTGNKQISFGADYLVPITSTKLYASMGLESNDLTSPYNNPTQKIKTTRISGGVTKDLHFGRNFFLGLSLGAAMEISKAEDDNFNQTFGMRLESDDENYKDMGVSKIGYDAGASLGFYLGPGMRIAGNINYAPVNYKDASEFTVGEHYTKFVREPLSYGVSLYFSFSGM